MPAYIAWNGIHISKQVDPLEISLDKFKSSHAIYGYKQIVNIRAVNWKYIHIPTPTKIVQIQLKIK